MMFIFDAVNNNTKIKWNP